MINGTMARTGNFRQNGCMSELVNYVEARGYLERVPDPQDRRASIVRLSVMSEALNQAAPEIPQEIEEEAAKEIGWEQMSALKQGLNALVNILEKEKSKS